MKKSTQIILGIGGVFSAVAGTLLIVYSDDAKKFLDDLLSYLFHIPRGMVGYYVVETIITGLFIYALMMLIYGIILLMRHVSKPLQTALDKATNKKMNRIGVYLPDERTTKYGEARFLFLSVTNKKDVTLSGIKPSLRIKSMNLDRELWIIHPPPKEFITVTWPDQLGSKSFEAFDFPFANALTSKGNKNICEEISLDPKQTKGFLVFFTSKEGTPVFTTVKGRAAYKDRMPCEIDAEVYYSVKDKGLLKGAKLHINARDWCFPERDTDVTVKT